MSSKDKKQHPESDEGKKNPDKRPVPSSPLVETYNPNRTHDNDYKWNDEKRRKDSDDE
jgi:hypothetical protein